MGRLVRESLFTIKQSKAFFILLLLQYFVLFFCITFFSNLAENELSASRVNPNKVGFYYVIDNLVGDYEEDFRANSDYLFRLKKMSSLLHNSGKYEYMEIYKNPVALFLEPIPQKIADWSHKDSQVQIGEIWGKSACEVNGMYVSVNSLNYINGGMMEGSLPSECDFFNSVVVGSEFAEMVNIGDELELMAPFTDKIRMKVVGILNEGANIYFSGKYQNLDRFIVFPLMDIKDMPIDDEDETRQRILYYMKINGQFVTDASPDEIQDYVNASCAACEIYPASIVEGSSNAQNAITGESIKLLLDSLKEIMVIVGTFSLISTILFTILRVKREKKYYAILLMNGYSGIEMTEIIVLSSLYILIIGLCGGGFIAKALLNTIGLNMIFYSKRILAIGFFFILVAGITGYQSVFHLSKKGV